MNRRAVSSTLGAVIFFAMLFTTGLGFFTFVSTTSFLQEKAAVDRLKINLDMKQEQLTVTTFSQNGKIVFYINNTGAATINVTQALVSNSTYFSQMNTSPFPIVLNTGTSSSVITTGATPTSGQTYTIKVVTKIGNVATGTYPEKASAQAVAQSAVSQSVGSLSMTFGSFKSTNLSVTPLVWVDGGNVLGSAADKAFKVVVINHDTRDIYLTKYTTIILLAAGAESRKPYYIVQTISNSTGTLTAIGENSILVPANPGNIAQGGTPTTVFFAAKDVGTATPQNQGMASDQYVLFFAMNGWFNSPTSNQQYSQTIPFQSVRVR